jgi:hypothetical protein
MKLLISLSLSLSLSLSTKAVSSVPLRANASTIAMLVGPGAGAGGSLWIVAEGDVCSICLFVVFFVAFTLTTTTTTTIGDGQRTIVGTRRCRCATDAQRNRIDAGRLARWRRSFGAVVRFARANAALACRGRCR